MEKFDFTDVKNINRDYRGFVLLSVDSLPDYNTKGVYLRHKETGLDVYHILSDDEENLFSFAFRTLSRDSMGTAHVIEHSVLCGSEKFPLREPFTTLDSRSVKTFLNAMTYPDRTAYPAASLVRSDYFNLMDVYADAVFFPLLRKETFLQEGHRLELDAGGNISVQGVVYNEMKGNYSSFMSVAISRMIDSMYPDSVYGFDSGGDPLDITSMTYSHFLDFHRKFYRPDNCLLFLYGNIPTADQLDFISDRYIPRLLKKFGPVRVPLDPNPVVGAEIRELQRTVRLSAPFEGEFTAPVSGATGEMVSVSWYSGKSDMEKAYLSEVLCGNDSSPMSIRLRESGLGDDLSPACGNFGQVVPENIFSFGLCGVARGDETKVRDLILNSLREIYDEGISRKDIDSAVMGMDFSLREVTRSWGPYSLVLMSKVLNGWNYGNAPSEFLSPVTAFGAVKEKIRSDPDYTRSLIKKYFPDDAVTSFVTVVPSGGFFDGRKRREEEFIASVSASLDMKELRGELDALHEFQQRPESQSETACIPHLKIAGLPSDIEQVETSVSDVPVPGGSVTLLSNIEPTNGIVYVDVLFPVDVISPSLFSRLPLFAGVLTDLGWGGKNWAECTSEMACVMGDISARIIAGSQVPDEDGCSYAPGTDVNIRDRYWLCISCKFLASMADQAMPLLSEIISGMDFSDTRRMEDLVSEFRMDRKSSFIENGAYYAGTRSRMLNSRAAAVCEIMYGITQLVQADAYGTSDVRALLDEFRGIYDSVRAGGALLHFTADRDSAGDMVSRMREFAAGTGLRPLGVSPGHTAADYIPFIYRPHGYNSSAARESVPVDSQTGYAAAMFRGSSWTSAEYAADTVLASWLTLHPLWEKVRTTGGAYGGSACMDGTECVCMMTSWRDPVPARTLDVFVESLRDAAERIFTPDETECAVLSCYSDELVPESPAARGNRGMNRTLYGTSPEMVRRRIRNLTAVTPDDVHASAERLLRSAEEFRREVVICDKSAACTGNILEIPL